MTYPASRSDAGTNRVRLDAAQFWAGAVATAVVAALIALVGILICRWTLNIPILAPAGEGAWGNAHTAEYALLAALIAIIAAGLLYLLVLGTPQPTMFFDWILGLVTLAAVVYPFSTGAPLDQKAATAVVNLVLGIAITSLLTAVAARAIRRPVPPAYGDRVGYRPEPGYEPEQGYVPGQDYPADPGYAPEPRRNQPTQPIDVPHGRGARRY
jgi:uncharacterized protein DUF6069